MIPGGIVKPNPDKEFEKKRQQYEKLCAKSGKQFDTDFRGPQRQYAGCLVGSPDHKAFLEAKHDLTKKHYDRMRAAYREVFGTEAYERSCKNGTWDASERVLRDLREAYE
jgi:hypothetical protein